MQHFEAVVIGSGQGGNPLASAFAKAGQTTALIERGAVGGTCINYGCTPTKTMVASAEIANFARRANDFGVQTGTVSVDMKAVRQRKREMVRDFHAGSEKRFVNAPNLQLIRGIARFTGPKTLELALNEGGSMQVTSNLIVIDSGTNPAKPNLEGLDSVPWLDNVSLMEMDAVPEHLLVLGGGYVGLEFGQMFRRFGSKVTLVHNGPQLLNREDEDVAEEVLKILREDEIGVLLNSKATRVARNGSGIRLTIEGDSQKQIDGSHLLVAVGRTPNTEELNLPAAGVKTDKRGFIEVDDRLQTTTEGVYAIGDVNGGPAFTHISYDDFRVLKANLLDHKPATTLGRPVPYTVYIDPQLGRIGVTEAEARKQGKRVRVAKMPMTSVARAIEIGQTRGFLKAIVEDGTDQILGATCFGAQGGEIAAMIEIAMMGRLPYTALRDGIFAHPAFSESLNNLFARLEG